MFEGWKSRSAFSHIPRFIKLKLLRSEKGRTKRYQKGNGRN